MNLFMSLPAVEIPEPKSNNRNKDIDPFYKKLCEIFSHSVDVNDESINLPRSEFPSGELFASKAIKSLLSRISMSWEPDMLIDCRSSSPIGGPAPTYHLANLCKYNKILPLLLQGQGGSEVAQGLFFCHIMGGKIGKGCVISGIQQLNNPDKRVTDNMFPFADASAAVGIATNPTTFPMSFNVNNIKLGHMEEFKKELIKDLYEGLLNDTKTKHDEIQWVIAQRINSSFLSGVKKLVHQDKWKVRDIYPEFNFGCADVLISLYRIFGVGSNPPIGKGCVWFVGRYGDVGVVLLDSRSVSMWKRHVSETPLYARGEKI